MHDLLKQSAMAYQSLTRFRYYYVLGKKDKEYHVTLEFPEHCFKHLAGLHKTRIEALKNKKDVLKTILHNDLNIPENEMLISRWKNLCALKDLVEASGMVFRYRTHEFKGSVISAEYLITDMNTMFLLIGVCL